MKPEEVIEVLNEILDILGLSHCSNLSECIAVNKAIQALEKQKPMKPDRLDGFRCRNCSGKLARQTDLVRQKYCHHCGQKIEWEEANEGDTIQR